MLIYAGNVKHLNKLLTRILFYTKADSGAVSRPPSDEWRLYINDYGIGSGKLVAS